MKNTDYDKEITYSSIVGLSFEDLTEEEMMQSQGGYDPELAPRSGPPCFLVSAGSALLVTFVWCK